MTRPIWILACTAVFMLASCTGEAPTEKVDHGDVVEEVVTNRIDIPATVVSNLGITFAKVEKRFVRQTLRAPGQFESPPHARREYFSMLPGRVEVLVKQYQKTEPGTPLFTLEPPEWRVQQQELAAADVAVSELVAERGVLVAERNAASATIELYPAREKAMSALADAGTLHVLRLEEARDHWLSRVVELEDLQAKKIGKAAELADARGEVKSALADIAGQNERQAEIAEQLASLQAEKKEREIAVEVFEARIAALDAKIQSARSAFDLKLVAAASAVGVKLESLRTGEVWRTLSKFTVTADSVGVVEHSPVSNGAWVDANTEIISTLDLSQLRFRARGLQSDLGLLKDGLAVSVVMPVGGSLETSEPAKGTLRMPTEADGDERVIDLIVEFETVPVWARPGVTAEAEIVYDEKTEPTLAIPLRCVIKDGLDKIIFQRDPDDPNKAIRKTPTLGATDGRWIEIFTGTMAGREIVLDGVYELKLTGAGKSQVDGHFHADGTFHAGKHSDNE